MAGSISPVKITEREGFARFSWRIVGNESTSRITEKEYLGVSYLLDPHFLAIFSMEKQLMRRVSTLPVKPFQLSTMIGCTNNHLFDNATEHGLRLFSSENVTKSIHLR